MVLSLRTEYLRRILAGTKTHEFRRRRVALRAGDRVLIYEVSPVGMITAGFSVADVLHGPPEELLRLEADGAAREFLRGYLSGCLTGTAIAVRDPQRLPQALPLAAAGLTHAPQSYAFARPALR